ncbi:COMM domain-containing protein 1 [Microtus ochrogaster]|uniref:COMM domain-containing protein 1 n=1 Tax=Microtus ochrogaster TaxID=79684 RepID=A0A8J6H2E1_MICOH|nr:COMM domain-containing protein 1 [Microtus ochrogaster]
MGHTIPWLEYWTVCGGRELSSSKRYSPSSLQESEFLCLEFDEVKVKQVLKRLSEVEESICTLMQAA